MLTRELLAANAALSGLTEEQVSAILTLSQNDENSVIAKKTGEIYGALDADILATSGIAKNGIEKTYEYAKRVIGEIKGKADSVEELNSRISQLTKEKGELEKAIADGAADKEAAKQLQQAKADLASVTAQYAELNTKYEEAQAKFENELFGVKMDNEMREAASGLKFKSGLPESVTAIILQNAVEKIKGMKPEYIDDGKGGNTLVFKGEDGAILRNPNNQLNPYTPADMLAKELDAMGVLDKGRKAQGAGTKPAPGTTGGTGSVVDIAGAKTRKQAYDAIESSLLAQGLLKGSKAFQDALDQAWKDNDIAKLPE